jgi:hypothetical protein
MPDEFQERFAPAFHIAGCRETPKLKDWLPQAHWHLPDAAMNHLRPDN